MKESEKCINFLENNGWKFTHNENENDKSENCSYYDNSPCFSIGIDFKNDSITFFDDTGDIHTCDINVFTLIGFLIFYRQIGCGFKPFGYKDKS